jgi:hypothetical protein
VLVGSGTKANKLEAVKVTGALLRCTSISVGPDLLIDNQISSTESEYFIPPTIEEHHREVCMTCIIDRPSTEDKQPGIRSHANEYDQPRNPKVGKKMKTTRLADHRQMSRFSVAVLVTERGNR